MSQQINLSSVVEFDSIIYNEQSDILGMVSLKAPTLEVEDSEKRAPIDVICVIDRSGSMAGSKIELTKKALLFVVDQLDKRDSLGLVTYDTDVNTDFELIKMDKDGKEFAKKVIKKIAAGSSTNLSGGLLHGLMMAKNRPKPNDVCSILLLTDGLANVGATSIPEIEQITKDGINRCKKGTTVFSFGFGSDHSSDMLKGIAEAGKGMYYFIETTDQIPTSFADCIGGLLSVVAQNIKVSVKTENNATISSFLNRGITISEGSIPGNSCSIALTDLYSEETREFVFKFTLPKLLNPVPQPTLFCTIKIDYFNILTSSDESATTSISIIRSLNVDENRKRHPDIERQYNRIIAVDAFEKSRMYADAGQFDEARQVLQTAQVTMDQSPMASDAFVMNLQQEAIQAMDLMSETSYNAVGKNAMKVKERSHQQQRGADLSSNMYQNKSKMAKKAFFS